VVSEDELFGGNTGSHEGEILGEPVTNDLSTKVKILSDDSMNIYALIISDPRKHGHELNELRRNVVKLAATLLEHNVKIEVPTKERTAQDVLQEAAGELGSMFGAKGVVSGLSFVNRIRENINTNREELVIYEDDDGNLFYIDTETGDEVDCDEQGTPLTEEGENNE
jgi:hypothetical protein